MRQIKVDLRPRCKRCHKIPRGKLNVANFERYAPYCSYHCQQWAQLEDAQRYINTLPPLPPNTEPSNGRRTSDETQG